jgi:hypothetical protein
MLRHENMRLHRIVTANKAQICHLEKCVLTYTSNATPANAKRQRDLPFLRPLWPTVQYQQPPLTALRYLPACRHLAKPKFRAAPRHPEAS